MKSYWFFFAFFFATTITHAQETYGDSILNSNLPDTAKLRLVRPWIKANAPNLREPVLRVTLAAVQLAQKTADPKLLAFAWNDLGSAYFYQEKAEDSGAAFAKARTFSLQSGDAVSLMTALRGLTHYYRDKGDNVHALEMVQTMETLLPQIKDPTMVSACFTHFCNIYTGLHRWKEVEVLARRAIAFNLQNQLVRQLPGAYYHLGKSFETNNVLDSALYYMQKAKIGFAAINNQEELAGMTMQIAQLFSRLGKPDEAVREMETALQIVEQNRDSAGIAYVSMEKGKLMMQYNRNQEAEVALKRSIAIFEHLNITAYKKDIYATLSDFYERTGRAATALLFFKKYIAIRDTIEGAESKKQLAELEATFENAKKEQQIHLLSRTNDNQRLQIGLLAALVGLLLSGALAALLLIRNRQRKSLIQEQQRWAKNVVDSTEAERRRIAADLHDGIAQQIAAIKMYTGGLLRTLHGEQRVQAENLSIALDNTGREVRQLSHQMMPRSLAELGLSAALEDLVWLSFSQTETHAAAHTEQYNLPPNLTTDTALYRIAQEAVNNIIKHAQAKNVTMTLKNSASTIFLLIADDGIGFEANQPDRAAYSLGMESMQSRVRLCGGTLSVTSKTGAGVQIEAKIPVSG